MQLTIHNSSTQTLVVVSVKLTPGQSKTVPFYYILEDYQQMLDLSSRVSDGKVQTNFSF